MTQYAPEYYPMFRCLAGACRHNCCIGWEIDLDRDALERYRAMEGDWGARLRARISEGEEPHFLLDEKERCPFLNRDNLCEMILDHGEAMLCDICADHPRFRNFFDHATEIGLGLCCEAAARLILLRTEPTRMIRIAGEEAEFSEEETMLLRLREKVTAMLQDRTIPFERRVTAVEEHFGLHRPRHTLSVWAERYRKLWRLDEAWTQRLDELATLSPTPLGETRDLVWEQLAVYFLYRHLPDGLWDGRYAARVLFALHGTEFVAALCGIHQTKYHTLTPEDICEIARMYSAEIEYNEENMERLLQWMTEEPSQPSKEDVQ